MYYLIEPFTAEQTPRFLQLADEEGWVVLPWEIPFLQQMFPDSCLCGVDGEGSAIGFVTGCLHTRSGWIGNLVVDPSVRGTGIGSALFKAATDSLARQGAETLWLTASREGRRIYERMGFRVIGRIIRYTGPLSVPLPSPTESAASGQCDVITLDAAGWGDQRTRLIFRCLASGSLLTRPSGFLVIQQAGERSMIGPWGVTDEETAEVLMAEAAHRIGTGECFIDVPEENRLAISLFERMGLVPVGENDLMWRGIEPCWNPSLIYGLATMGSCG